MNNRTRMYVCVLARVKTIFAEISYLIVTFLQFFQRFFSSWRDLDALCPMRCIDTRISEFR